MSISVIIPAFQMGQFLPDALNSVIRQGLPIHEIFVIDPGSTDNTKDVATRFLRAGFPIHYHYIEQGGPALARNVGLRQAKSDVIAFLDADDLWPEDKLLLQYQRLINQPKLDVVAGFVRYFETLDPKSLAPQLGTRTRTLLNVNVGAYLYRRSVFDRLGLFDERLQYCEDVDLLNRIRECDLTMVILRSITLFYRCHPTSMMRQKTLLKDADYKRVCQSAVERQVRCGQPDIPRRLWDYLEQ